MTLCLPLNPWPGKSQIHSLLHQRIHLVAQFWPNFFYSRQLWIFGLQLLKMGPTVVIWIDNFNRIWIFLILRLDMQNGMGNIKLIIPGFTVLCTMAVIVTVVSSVLKASRVVIYGMNNPCSHGALLATTSLWQPTFTYFKLCCHKTIW